MPGSHLVISSFSGFSTQVRHNRDLRQLGEVLPAFKRAQRLAPQVEPPRREVSR